MASPATDTYLTHSSRCCCTVFTVLGILLANQDTVTESSHSRSCVSSSSVLRPPIPRWCPVRAWLFFTFLPTYLWHRKEFSGVVYG